MRNTLFDLTERRSRRWINWRQALVGVACSLILIGAAPAFADDATSLVRGTSERMLQALEARRAEIDRNPTLIYGLVEDILLPHFDFEKITRAAVGSSWSKATPQQQSALIKGFQQVLVRTYAKSLLSYSGQEIRYLPSKPGRQSGTVTVSTEVRERGSTPIPIEYRLYQKGGGWKVYDVIIDNVSLVSNYRSSFASQIRQGGIDGLIRRLDEMNAKGQG